MAEKQGILASLYFDTGKTAEAESLFQEAWSNYSKSAVKIPWMHGCFADYLKILNTTGDTDTAARVRAALNSSNKLALAQKSCILLVTAPIIAFLLYNQATERSIAKHNAQGQIIVAMRELSWLARSEAFLMGDYAAAKVYADYAQAFAEVEGQLNEMDLCTDMALASLRRSGKKDEYLQVILLNLKAKSDLSEGNNTEALRHLNEAVAISLKWDKDQLAQNRYDATIERDKAIVALAELDRNNGRYERAEQLYKQVMDISDSNAELEKARRTLQDPVETVDRLHKLQHIELKLGKKTEAVQLQEQVCKILEDTVRGLAITHKNSVIADFGSREAARELDICALMLEDTGKSAEAKDYQARAEKLRSAHRKALKLDSAQQDSIVDAATKVTNDLLSVKYQAGDWHQSLNHLLKDELTSKRALGAFEHLPWYNEKNIKLAADKKATPPERTMIVDIEPLSIRSNREGDGIAVDVQGTVKIVNAKSKSEDEQKFGFAYILKSKNAGHQTVDDLLDNQALAHVQFD